LGDKLEEEKLIFFDDYTQGLLTARDKWCYSFGKEALLSNVALLLKTYDADRKKVAEVIAGLPKRDREAAANEVINTDPKQISWSRGLKGDVIVGNTITLRPDAAVPCAYRPFSNQWLYFDAKLNEYPARIPTLFPKGKLPNVAICVDSRGSTKEFSTLVVDTLPDYEYISKGQCFPLYLYEPAEGSGQLNLSKSDGEIIDGYRRRDAITDEILKTFRGAYEKDVTKEDIFYYVYGVLHSPEYRTRFAADLKKMLPRIPLTKETRDFKAFSKAGRQLAQWHLNYETVEPWKLEEQMDRFNFDPSDQFKVTKMTFARPTPAQKEAGAKWDKTKVIFNSHVTLSGIPLDAYEYVVNGKPAIEWILERYQLTRDKDSGIVNDPNDWCMEHNQPRYIIDLLKRVVRVSMETMKIVKRLPALNERSDTVEQAKAKVRLRFVQPKPEDRYVTCVPFVPLKVAAGTFGDPQHLEHENFEWVEVQSKHRLRPGMFVAQVNGRSMEPMIPDGSYCLFTSPVEGSRQGKTVLVQLRDEVDPETGERYTVKRYESQKVKTGDSWRHARITLKPLNPEFEPIELADVSEEVSVVAEWVEVLSGVE
jgi:phage repressor protein C with HTH and peptisase S24 domain